LGTLLAFWREKTFQTLAMTALGMLVWVGAGEAVAALGGGRQLGGWPLAPIAIGLSPKLAIFAAAQPMLVTPQRGWLHDGVHLYLVVSLAATAVLNAATILLVRVWNPSRELRAGQLQEATPASIWGERPEARPAAAAAQVDAAKTARAEHVDARVHAARTDSRRVWDNPILWREVCTWAYGRKVLLIHFAYAVLFVLAWLGLAWTLGHQTAAGPGLASVIPAAAMPLAPFFLVSLVIVNALAVTSITNERDGQALDLLLVTDLSPRELVFGKLGGVFWVTKGMVLGPLLLCGYVWWHGDVSLENLLYVLVGLAVMYVFVSMLGLHCGMTYANSRTAIGVSLGLVFFLFLGVATCMLIMISFSGSFQNQLAPFLAFILGGSAGLYMLLGYRNPSHAIQVASLLLPLATFYSVTSFLLKDSLAVFLVVTGTYGFATAALMMPAISEFDIAVGRTRGPEEE
jgi:ABC-type transport system involved in multi-copper enzyme maturation permease subunit